MPELAFHRKSSNDTLKYYPFHVISFSIFESVFSGYSGIVEASRSEFHSE